MFLGTASDGDVYRGRATDWAGGFTAYQTLTNSECHGKYLGSEAVGDKVHGREGKTQIQQLRSLNIVKLIKRGGVFYNSQDVGLEAAIHLKSA